MLASAALWFVLAGTAEFTSDFLAFYRVAVSLVDGVPIYDEHQVAEHLAACCDIEHKPLAFAYPPWLMLLMGWLGHLPFGAAGRLWLVVNLSVLLLSLWLLNRGQPFASGLIVSVMALTFGPVLSLLAVGQVSLLVLLGAAVLAANLHRRSGVPAALGLVLLSLKPHVGLAVLLLGAPSVLRRVRSIWLPASALAVGLIVGSSWASPGWYMEWPAAMVRISAEESVVRCDTCASLSVFVERFSPLPATAVMLVLLALFLGLGLWRRRVLRDDLQKLGLGVSAMFLSLSYVRNYDGAVLVLPLVALWVRGDRAGRLTALAGWVLATLSALSGHRELSAVGAGATALLFVTVLLLPPRPDPVEGESLELLPVPPSPSLRNE